MTGPTIGEFLWKHSVILFWRVFGWRYHDKESPWLVGSCGKCRKLHREGRRCGLWEKIR